MLIKNQIVETSCGGRTKNWFRKKGYCFDNGVKFYCKAEDLNHGSKVFVMVECDYCNITYSTAYGAYLKSLKKLDKAACFNCREKKRSEIYRLECRDEQMKPFYKKCREMNFKPLTEINEFVGKDTIVKFACSKHGEKQTTLDLFKRTKYICVDCASEKSSNRLRIDRQKIKDVIQSKNGNTWLNEDSYTFAIDTNLKIRCGLCGNTFSTSYVNYRKANVDRCRVCSNRQSKGELQIEKFLSKNKIPFEPEKKFDDCRNIQPLPFDFYIESKNTIIEFDGRHHYEPLRGRELLLKTIKHDNIKDNYCKQNNINLIRIPYWEQRKINEILSEKLNINN